MDSVTAPSSLNRERPFLAGEEEEEHKEKKPVLKKVKDKVKKIKKAISKKTPGHGNEGDVDDHLDEGVDEGFEEDEEINEVHGVPSALYENSAIGAGTAAKEISKEELVEDPTASRTEPETNMRIEHSQNLLDIRIEQSREYESPATDAEGVRDGLGLITEKFVGDLTPPRTEAETNTRIEQSSVHLSPTTGARIGANEISGGGGRGEEGVDGVGDDSDLINIELVEDPAVPTTESVTNAKIEQSQGGEAVEISPDLSRSLEAMTVSKDQNNSYTGMVSSAASKVYEIVADAGTAVISKVKPDARMDGKDEAVPEGGKGVGVVEKIRETVTSFLGGGEGSPKSPATEAHGKVAEDNKDFNRRLPEAISHEKRSSEELPNSYHTDDTRIE